MKGDVVVVPFPFSDLSDAKRRPALVVAEFPGDDLILCQITSQSRNDPHALPLGERDFAAGSLERDSYIRCGRIFTADQTIILRRVGRLTRTKIDDVIDTIVNILRSK